MTTLFKRISKIPNDKIIDCHSMSFFEKLFASDDTNMPGQMTAFLLGRIFRLCRVMAI